MTALATTIAKHPHPVNKLLQVARHRVVRWFRPTEADLRRGRAEPHPHPKVVPPFPAAHEQEVAQ